jgi:hypothetical protein
MSHEDLQAVARKDPFKPFRVILTTGATYDIRHPDLIMIGRRSAVIGFAKDEGGTIYDRATWVDLLHIVGVEELPVKSSGNGEV